MTHPLVTDGMVEAAANSWTVAWPLLPRAAKEKYRAKWRSALTAALECRGLEEPDAKASLEEVLTMLRRAQKAVDLHSGDCGSCARLVQPINDCLQKYTASEFAPRAVEGGDR